MNSSTRAPRPPSTRNPFAKRALRRKADEILRGGARVHPESALLLWRAAELMSPRERRITARSLRGLVEELDGKALPGAVPLLHSRVRPHVPALSAIASRIGDIAQPVTPKGMLLVRDLLSHGVSPLCARQNAEQLPDRLRAIERELGTGS